MQWTEERIELLKKRWAEGLSSSQIAAELGGVTRNAVIGKALRLGLTGRSIVQKRRTITAEARGRITKIVKEKPQLPPLKPSTIEPIARNGKISIQRTNNSNLNREFIKSALTTLKTSGNKILSDLQKNSNIDARFISFFKEHIECLPKNVPNKANIFRLGHECQIIEEYIDTATKEWAPFIASQYIAFFRNLERTLRQFPDWRQFQENAKLNRINKKEQEAAIDLSRQFSKAMRSPDDTKFFDKKFIASFDSLIDQDQKINFPELEDIYLNSVSEDIVTSFENFLKLCCDISLSGWQYIGRVSSELSTLSVEAANKFWNSARESVVLSAESSGKQFGPTLIRWSRRIIISAAAVTTVKISGIGAVLNEIVKTFSKRFEWLNSIVNFIS